MHGPFATVISIKQRYEGHARQVASVASGVRATLALGRFIIVVDEDIDPSDLRDVFWAITTRCDPAIQTEILREFPTSDINPRVPPIEGKVGLSLRKWSSMPADPTDGFRSFRRPMR